MTDMVKRPRGRPKGSGKDDSKMLAAVADAILSKGIKPTTAMKRLVRDNIKSEDRQHKEHQINADVRRLQEKWAASGEELLAAARKRAEAREETLRRARAAGGGGGAYYSGAIGSTVAEMGRTLALTQMHGGIGSAVADMSRRWNELDAFTKVNAGLGSAIADMTRNWSHLDAITKAQGGIGGTIADMTRNWSHLDAITKAQGGIGSTEEQQFKALGYSYNPRTGMPW